VLEWEFFFFLLTVWPNYDLVKWTSPFRVKFRWIWLYKMNPFKVFPFHLSIVATFVRIFTDFWHCWCSV